MLPNCANAIRRSTTGCQDQVLEQRCKQKAFRRHQLCMKDSESPVLAILEYSEQDSGSNESG